MELLSQRIYKALNLVILANFWNKKEKGGWKIYTPMNKKTIPVQLSTLDIIAIFNSLVNSMDFKNPSHYCFWKLYLCLTKSLQQRETKIQPSYLNCFPQFLSPPSLLSIVDRMHYLYICIYTLIFKHMVKTYTWDKLSNLTWISYKGNYCNL